MHRIDLPSLCKEVESGINYNDLSVKYGRSRSVLSRMYRAFNFQQAYKSTLPISIIQELLPLERTKNPSEIVNFIKNITPFMSIREVRDMVAKALREDSKNELNYRNVLHIKGGDLNVEDIIIHF